METSSKVDYEEKHVLILSLKGKDIKNVDGVMGRTGGSIRNKLLKGVDRMFGQSDPYYQIRNIDNEVVAQSEVVMNDLKPSFAPLFIDIERLCGGNAHNFHQPFTITFYDWQPKGHRHRFLGTITTSVRQCMNKADEYQEAYELISNQDGSQQHLSFRQGNSRNRELSAHIEPSFLLKADGENCGQIYCTKAQVVIGTPTPLQKELIIRKRRHSSMKLPSKSKIPTSISFRTKRSTNDNDGTSLDSREIRRKRGNSKALSSSTITTKSINTDAEEQQTDLAAPMATTAMIKKQRVPIPQQIDMVVQQVEKQNDNAVKTPTSNNTALSSLSSPAKKGQSSSSSSSPTIKSNLSKSSILPSIIDANDKKQETEMTKAPTNYIFPPSFDVLCSLFVLELKATNLFYGVFRHANSYKIAHHNNKTTSATSWSQDHLMGGADFFYYVATRHAIVAQSTVYMKNLHPTFAPLAIGVESLRRGFQLPPRSLQDEDGSGVQDAEILLNGELYLWFFDWEEDGKHTPMGYIKTSLRGLLQASLHRKKKRRKSKRRKSGVKEKEEEEEAMLSQITMNNIQYGKVYVTRATFVKEGLPTFWDPSRPTIVDENDDIKDATAATATVSQKDAVDDDDGGGKPKSIKNNDEEENDGIKTVSQTSSMVLGDDLLDSSVMEVDPVVEKHQQQHQQVGDGTVNDKNNDMKKKMNEDAASLSSKNDMVDDDLSPPHEEGIEVVDPVAPSSLDNKHDEANMSQNVSFSDNTPSLDHQQSFVQKDPHPDNNDDVDDDDDDNDKHKNKYESNKNDSVNKVHDSSDATTINDDDDVVVVVVAPGLDKDKSLEFVVGDLGNDDRNKGDPQLLLVTDSHEMLNADMSAQDDGTNVTNVAATATTTNSVSESKSRELAFESITTDVDGLKCSDSVAVPPSATQESLPASICGSDNQGMTVNVVVAAAAATTKKVGDDAITTTTEEDKAHELISVESGQGTVDNTCAKLSLSNVATYTYKNNSQGIFALENTAADATTQKNVSIMDESILQDLNHKTSGDLGKENGKNASDIIMETSTKVTDPIVLHLQFCPFILSHTYFPDKCES